MSAEPISRKTMPTKDPRVSVVYLTKNGGGEFLRSLEAVRHQVTDFSYEVVVIDSGSADGTPEHALQAGMRVIRIPASEFNYGGTKNLGARLARGEILVFLSQDNIPAKSDWLANLVRHFRDGVGAVQGPSVSEDWGYYWWRAGGFFFTRETRRWLHQYGIGLSSCNLAIRREVVLDIPFQHVPMMEDKVMQKALASAGVEVAEAPDAPVLHTHVYDAHTLVQRLTNEGLGWRYAGGVYSLSDVALDAVSPVMWSRAFRAFVGGKIRGAHELLFPVLRPLFVYRGLHSETHYRWEKDGAAPLR